MTLPAASTRLSSQGGSAPVPTDLLAIWAPVPTLADGVPRLYSSVDALLAAHGDFEGSELHARHIDDTGKAALLVPMPIATAGLVKRSESVHTGTSKVTVAVGGSGALAETDAIMKVSTGGTIGTDQILLSLSLDGGVTYKTVRLGTASSYVVPRMGLTVSFGAGTLVAGDTCLKWQSTAPMFDSAGVTLGKAGLVSKQWKARSWIFVGDVSTLALGQAIETAVNAYETANERYTRAVFQARDWRRLQSSALRCAMVGHPSLTFAEVGATGDTITRATGSWVTDGFQVGDFIRVTGTASNNVSGKITGVTATVLTLDTTDLAAETIATEDPRITAEASLVFATTTITRNTGSWIAEGFAVGDTVTIAGTASNNGTAIITTLSATVMTCSASSFSAETIGTCTASVTLTETDAAWTAAVATLFASISSSSRVTIGAGRLTKVSPITGYTMRRPVAWAETIRAYQRDIKFTTWEKGVGALTGWGIDGEHDERVTPGLLDGLFTCARTWGNGPSGAFIAQGLTRLGDGSVLGMSHNRDIANVAQTACQQATEAFVGLTLNLNRPDVDNKRTAKATVLADLAAKVNTDLRRNLLEDIEGTGGRASFASWAPSTDDDLGTPGTPLTGTLTLELNGTLVTITTTGRVR